MHTIYTWQRGIHLDDTKLKAQETLRWELTKSKPENLMKGDKIQAFEIWEGR